ncbi:MAG: hypothetical protein WB780_10920 [Candidatus Acidiferrales bacterium]
MGGQIDGGACDRVVNVSLSARAAPAAVDGASVATVTSARLARCTVAACTKGACMDGIDPQHS